MGTHVIMGSAHRTSTTTPPGSGAVSTYWTQQGCPPKMSMTHKGKVKPDTECNVLHWYWGVHRPTSPLMSAHHRQNKCKCIFLITQPSVSTSIYYPGMTIEIVNTSTTGQGVWILELHCPPPPLNFIYVCYMFIKPLSCWRRIPQQSILSCPVWRTSPSRTWSHGRRLERPWRCATNFSRETG